MVFVSCFFTACIQAESGTEKEQAGKITAPPESLKLDPFYKKYIDVHGIEVYSSDKVADEALFEVKYLIENGLSGRPDILKAMADNDVRIIIIAATEQVTDIPEYNDMDEYWNRRARGFGGQTTSCGEENLLNYPDDRYTGENIFLHEFGHCIDHQLRTIDPNFSKKLSRLYRDAMKRDIWKNTYAAENAAEYWAEGVQDFWDCNKQSRDGRADGIHNHVNTREELREYDPNLAALIEETLGNNPWRYTRYIDRHKEFVQKHKSDYNVEQIPQGKVIPVPKSIIERYDLDPNFYAKMVSCGGLPIMGSKKVDDRALLRAAEIADHLFAGREDVRRMMIRDDVRLTIIAAEEQTTDVPEYYEPDPVKRAYVNERARGYGGKMTSFGEENLLCLPIDRYDDENIMVHEFGGHCVDRMLRQMDREFGRKLRQLYRDAINRGLYKDTYAGSNVAEYWAEGVQSYFDCNRQNNWNHNYVNTREELYEYDPNLVKLIAETFRLGEEQDWRYKPMAKQPAVTTPPEKLGANKFYTKYVDCRSLPILGSAKASDEAMLKANEIIRSMFAYRHDILKAMIDAGLRVVVLADGENINIVPECAVLSTTVRCLTINKPEFRIVIGQDYILTPQIYGENMLVREFAKAIVTNVAARPVDPNFEKRSPSEKQQYELYGVQRVDERFGKSLEELYEKAMDKGLWKGTAATASPADYFAEGVQSWFDCNNKVIDEKGKPINTREQLKEYDPELADFIADTFKHTQREGFDWRCPVTDSEKKNPASDYLQRLSAKTRQLESYQCKIDYLFEQPVFESKSLRKGNLYYQKQKDRTLLRINFETLKEENGAPQDYKDEYIFDGRWLTHIDYQTKQVKRYEQTGEGEQIDAFELLRQSFPIIGFTKVEELQKEFEIKFVEQKSTKAGDFVQLNLKPKPQSQYAEDYVSIDFWIDTEIDLPSKIATVNTEQDIYTIELLKPVINKTIDKAIFEYKIPKDFTVEINKLDDEKK
jgi:alpha-glucosidase